MRFFGIDIGSEKHWVAALDDQQQFVLKATPFSESREGYDSLLALLGSPEQTLIAMEATGHYWQNLFITLAERGFQIALLNPLRTHRFAGEDLQRTKTDAVDALSIAKFAAQKRPVPTRLPDDATRELRELVRLRDRLGQERDDHVRQLHRLVDLGFPEFAQLVKSFDGALATTLLHKYPTARAYAGVHPGTVAKLSYGEQQHLVGLELARQLVAAAKTSIGQHHGSAYQVQVRYCCEDIDRLRQRLKELDKDLKNTLDQHKVGSLLTTIDGIAANSAARLVAELGDISAFKGVKALAAYLGVIPGLKQSGKNQSRRAPLAPLGHATLRAKLWMPTISAIKHNAWLKAYYDRLIARGKPTKVALVAATHKLLHAIYWVAKNEKPFVPKLPPAAPAN